MALALPIRSVAGAVLLGAALVAQGTPFQVADLATSAAPTYDYGPLFGGRLCGSFAVFLAGDAAETRIWRTDGTPAGTTLLLRVPVGYPSGTAVEVVGGNDRAFFVGPDAGAGTVLW
ncbi:MAG: hypothetical protein ACK5UQ_22175, partial [Planctomycetota bacterium]